jgi:hypothetical protein
MLKSSERRGERLNFQYFQLFATVRRVVKHSMYVQLVSPRICGLENFVKGGIKNGRGYYC